MLLLLWKSDASLLIAFCASFPSICQGDWALHFERSYLTCLSEAIERNSQIKWGSTWEEAPKSWIQGVCLIWPVCKYVTDVFEVHWVTWISPEKRKPKQLLNCYYKLWIRYNWIKRDVSYWSGECSCVQLLTWQRLSDLGQKVTRVNLSRQTGSVFHLNCVLQSALPFQMFH